MKHFCIGQPAQMAEQFLPLHTGILLSHMSGRLIQSRLKGRANLNTLKHVNLMKASCSLCVHKFYNLTSLLQNKVHVYLLLF